MMKAKVIKTESEYEDALRYLATLMDAAPGSPEADELELVSTLIEKYEEEHYPIALPDPIDAIQFRMEQAGLTRRDLEQYLGSQSKVSEVLTRKRPLSLAMIRALHTGLGIPAEVLLQEPGKQLAALRYDGTRYPLKEMVKRGYFDSFSGTLRQAIEQAEELLGGFFQFQSQPANASLYRRNSNREVDEFALAAWHARAVNLAMQQSLPPFRREDFTLDLLRNLVKLSFFSNGPMLAREVLLEQGVHLIALGHLPRTYLDGACFWIPNGHPVIGLTLRHDRLDYFWFTLLHELAHLYLHLPDQDQVFFDEFEAGSEKPASKEEKEANELCMDLLIPREIWDREKQFLLDRPQEDQIRVFADRLGIAAAIVAGRIRWETGDYSLNSDLVGSRMIRSAIPMDGK